MKQNTKDWIHYASAIAFLTSAIVLAFANFWLEHSITGVYNQRYMKQNTKDLIRYGIEYS